METKIPTFLYIGENTSPMYYTEVEPGHRAYFNVIYQQNDSNLQKLQNEYEIDLYITEVGDTQNVQNLYVQPLHIRKKWIEVEKDEPNKSFIIYNSYIRTILTNHAKTDLISIFTILSDNSPSILKTYHTLKSQSYSNWEWVVLDVSGTDDSLSLLKKIEYTDGRVKKYTLSNLKADDAGNNKYIAAGLTTGEFIVDLEQGDLLSPTACELIIRSSRQFPDAGFFYSDKILVNSDLVSLDIGENWAYGYGQYKEYTLDIFGLRVFNALVAPPVNPKTIRAPYNTFIGLKTWRRNAYLEARQYNRQLLTVYDYELLLKTFLTTSLVHINSPCYIEVLKENDYRYRNQVDYLNQTLSVRNFYEVGISRRFVELELEDWWDSNLGFNTENKYEEEQSRANFIFI